MTAAQAPQLTRRLLLDGLRRYHQDATIAARVSLCQPRSRRRGYARRVAEQPLKPARSPMPPRSSDADDGAGARAGLVEARAAGRHSAAGGVHGVWPRPTTLDVDARAEPVLAITILAGDRGAPAHPDVGPAARRPGDRRARRRRADVRRRAVLRRRGLLPARSRALARRQGGRRRGAVPRRPPGGRVRRPAARPLARGVLPAILLGFGSDWFRTGGSDEGIGRDIVLAIGLASAAWSVALVALGLRATFRLPWRGVAGALALAAVMVAAIVVAPSLL